VLRVLLRQPGRVVTRDELFAEVWPDTLPTNDVLTQAVTQLRKAFSNDDDNGQAYIETIAKTGYRLLVPVQALDDAEPSAAGAPDDEGVDVQPARRRRGCPRARRNRAAAGAMSAAACCWRWAC
jgi:DNA-binding winged helix-turn-helix (wHTH) protein